MFFTITRVENSIKQKPNKIVPIQKADFTLRALVSGINYQFLKNTLG